MEICKSVDWFQYDRDLRHDRVKATDVDRLSTKRNLTEFRVEWFAVFCEIFTKILFSGKIKYEEAKS